MVDGDPEQLHQVFVNLLLNGVESMPKGGLLTVAVEPDYAKHVCRVTFTDTGAGIPETLIARIFEPFITSKEHGTGLGLAISRRIIEEHAGTVGRPRAATRRPCCRRTSPLPACFKCLVWRLPPAGPYSDDYPGSLTYGGCLCSNTRRRRWSRNIRFSIEQVFDDEGIQVFRR